MLKKLALISLLSFLLPSLAFASADKYVFDKSHTHIIFFINHMGYSNTIGRIREYDGYFTFDEQNPAKSSIDVTLKPASVDTSVPALDKAICSDKFFNVTKFPTMHFKSTAVNVTGKDTGDITGDFTMLGVTKPATLHVKLNKVGLNNFTNNYTAGFTADAVLRRSDFGMNAYIPLVGDDVRIHIEVEASDPLKHPGNVKTPN